MKIRSTGPMSDMLNIKIARSVHGAFLYRWQLIFV